MADDVEMTPINPAELTPIDAVPPIVNPLKPELKPGLKLPPKPAMAAKSALPKPGLKPGLKLPAKPGATIALKPGLKLPPKPGATIVAKPLIRKPGTGATALPKPLPKPVQAAATPATPASAAPATPAPEAPKPQALESLKTVTQKLKGATQPIPQQAILHKTGIIADTGSDAQKEAAKHKTARISLSDAMGVAPVKDEHAPMKTIQIKRPINLPKPAATASAPAASPAPTAATTVTQRKTLKIARPGAVRPTGAKFGLKNPAQPAQEPAALASVEGGEVADIPEMPAVSAAPVPPMPNTTLVSDVPSWVTTLSMIVQLAACGVVGALAWFLYENTQTLYF